MSETIELQYYNTYSLTISLGLREIMAQAESEKDFVFVFDTEMARIYGLLKLGEGCFPSKMVFERVVREMLQRVNMTTGTVQYLMVRNVKPGPDRRPIFESTTEISV